MSSKKEEKAQAADEKTKAAALFAAKGLSRAQAERAAAAAARNVNAYGQKEEGPSRWQERKEAKRQMYLMSTEKAVRLGERKDLKASGSTMGGIASQCQKCFQIGHWTYECKNERVYISRPSRSQQLKNPSRVKLVVSFEGNEDVQRRIQKEEEERKKTVKESKALKRDKKKKSSKRKHRPRSDSESDSSEASVFDSDSKSSSESDYSSDDRSSSYSSSDSEERRYSRRKKKQKKGRHRKYSSSSDSYESDSPSSSDSDDNRSRGKNKRHNRSH